MIIQHNLTAINSNRQLNITTGLQAKSSEKLSSGYKINRAADDAAGLAISEKMRRQIRGLDQAINNLQDGISVVQIADGALNETQSILQRANELSIKAANDTLTDSDRDYIQEEIDQITAEIDHIATTTNFNNEIFPLTGTVTKLQDTNFSFAAVTDYKIKVLNGSTTDQIFNGMHWNVGEYTYMEGIQFPDAEHRDGRTYYLHFIDGPITYGPKEPPYSEVTNGGTYYNGGYSLRKADFEADDEGYLYYTSKKDNTKYYFIKSNITGDVSRTSAKGINNYEYLKLGPETEQKDIWIQAGSEKDHGFTMHGVDATVAGLKLFPINVTTQESALKVVEAVKRGLHTVAEYRSYFGAMQNRMEHSVRNLSNVVENTQDAESLIRDTDMASEMVKYSNNNILTQAGQSMLAQANQTNQGVLSLLQ